MAKKSAEAAGCKAQVKKDFPHMRDRVCLPQSEDCGGIDRKHPNNARYLWEKKIDEESCLPVRTLQEDTSAQDVRFDNRMQEDADTLMFLSSDDEGYVYEDDSDDEPTSGHSIDYEDLVIHTSIEHGDSVSEDEESISVELISEQFAEFPIDVEAIEELLAQDKDNRRRAMEARIEELSARISAEKLTESVTRIQKMYRGAKVRETLKIQSIAPGMLKVDIRGRKELFDRISLRNDNILATKFHDPSDITYLSLAWNFEGQVQGGNETYRIPEMTGQELKASLTSPLPGFIAYINGGFFNCGQAASKSQPQHATMGECMVAGKEMPSIPIEGEHKADYYKIHFINDGVQSAVTAGPLLNRGVALFTKFEPRHEYKLRHTPRPGVMDHAATRNPRSVLIRPQKEKAKDPGNRTRLLVCLAKGRGETSSGLDMFELERLSRRLNRMNKNPGESCALDGGKSVVLGVLDENGNKIFETSQNKLEPNGGQSSFIVYAKSPAGI